MFRHENSAKMSEKGGVWCVVPIYLVVSDALCVWVMPVLVREHDAAETHTYSGLCEGGASACATSPSLVIQQLAGG